MNLTNRGTTMKLKTSISMILIGAFALAFAANVDAATAEEKGFEIAARADRSDLGFGDSEVELKMVLRNAAGQESTRSLRITTLEKPDESVGDKSLVLFDTPRDIEGTALLSHAKILDPDDQWLYLPALKRVKRISSSNKSGPFVGSEFAFEDFTAIELNKFVYRYGGEETCGDLVCDVIERTPRYENSGYTKQVSWIDQNDFQIRKVEFYDRRGDLLKVLELREYRNYEGVWRAHRLSMTNVQTNKHTDLVYGDYSFGVGLSENDFVKGRLSRLR
jgi:outer membrane lipoprotein-sorting protein